MADNLCKLCNKNPIDEKGYICGECMAKTSYQTKATIVLEDSESCEWGLVKLTPGTINHVPADSELVGTWSKYGEGTCWVNLMLPLNALMDRTTMLIAEVHRRRAENLPLMGTVRTATQRRSTGGSPRKQKVKEEAPEPEALKSLQALREKLRPKA